MVQPFTVKYRFPKSYKVISAPHAHSRPSQLQTWADCRAPETVITAEAWVDITLRLALPERLALPLVPVTVTWLFPVGVVFGVIVSPDWPGQLTGLLEKVIEAPGTDVLSCTGPLKPLLVEHVTV